MGPYRRAIDIAEQCRTRATYVPYIHTHTNVYIYSMNEIEQMDSGVDGSGSRAGNDGCEG